MHVLERNCRMRVLRDLEQHACAHFQVSVKVLKGPPGPHNRTFILLSFSVGEEG